MMYAKIGAGLALILGLFFGGWYCGSLHGKAVSEAASVAQLKSLSQAWQARELQTQAQSDRFANEIETLRVTRSGPPPGVALRVCFTAPHPLVPTAADPTLPATTGPLPVGNDPVPQPSGDIRPGLFAIADEADELVANCRRTQPAPTHHGESGKQ